MNSKLKCQLNQTFSSFYFEHEKGAISNELIIIIAIASVRSGGGNNNNHHHCHRTLREVKDTGGQFKTQITQYIISKQKSLINKQINIEQ